MCGVMWGHLPNLGAISLAFPSSPHGKGFAILLTGLPAAGKTTIANELRRRIEMAGRRVTVLDGEVMRAGISLDLGFSRSDREKNLMMAAHIASEVVKHQGIAICALIAPYDSSRKLFRQAIEAHGSLFLIFVSTPLEECERRDPKGLYAKAKAGHLLNFTGITDSYEVPTDYDVSIDTAARPLQDSVSLVLLRLVVNGFLPTAFLATNQTLPSNDCTPDLHVVTKNRQNFELLQQIITSMAVRRHSLSELVLATGVERHTLEATIRALTGRSFRGLQQALLLERAVRLLELGKASKEVAFILGFGSPQSFHRFVRRAAGTPPSAFSKEAGVGMDLRNERRPFVHRDPSD